MVCIFMTGSAGLITGVARRLEASGRTVVGCDLRSDVANEKYDLRDANRVREAMTDCSGVIHLGAVARNPSLCESVNLWPIARRSVVARPVTISSGDKSLTPASRAFTVSITASTVSSK